MEDAETKEKKTGSLHIITLVVLTLAICRNAMNIFKSLTLACFGDTLGLFSAITSFVIIICFILVMNKNKIGVIAFYILQVVNIIGLIVLGSQNAAITIVVALVMCAIFTALLFIRNKGVSGWNLIFNE